MVRALETYHATHWSSAQNWLKSSNLLRAQICVLPQTHMNPTTSGDVVPIPERAQTEHSYGFCQNNIECFNYLVISHVRCLKFCFTHTVWYIISWDGDVTSRDVKVLKHLETRDPNLIHLSSLCRRSGNSLLLRQRLNKLILSQPLRLHRIAA